MVTKARIIKIGNSRGVCIPKAWLDQLGLSDEVELVAEPDRIVIRSARRTRQGWDEQFRAMAQQGDDCLLDPGMATDQETGNFPAAEFARASLARKIVRRRRAAGLTQADLARRAGIRPETLNRIERGRTTPSIATVEKVTRAMEQAEIEDK